MSKNEPQGCTQSRVRGRWIRTGILVLPIVLILLLSMVAFAQILNGGFETNITSADWTFSSSYGCEGGSCSTDIAESYYLYNYSQPMEGARSIELIHDFHAVTGGGYTSIDLTQTTNLLNAAQISFKYRSIYRSGDGFCRLGWISLRINGTTVFPQECIDSYSNPVQRTVNISGWGNNSIVDFNWYGTYGNVENNGSLLLDAVALNYLYSTVTISCPIGWCFLSQNYSSKTLSELDAFFTTDTTQGFFDNSTKKYVNHRTGYAFNENKTVSQGQGYFYYFTSAQDVAITIPSSYSINLVTGWNMVSNFGANRTLSALATSITNTTAKQRYNATTKKWIDDDLDTVKQGEAFFAFVSANTTWVN